MNGLGLRAGVVIEHHNTRERFEVIGFSNKKDFRNPVCISWKTHAVLVSFNNLENYRLITARQLQQEVLARANRFFYRGREIVYTKINKDKNSIGLHKGTVVNKSKRVYGVFHVGFGAYNGFVSVVSSSGINEFVAIENVNFME